MSENQNIENLNKENLVKAFKRLKGFTKNFSSLIVRDPLDYLDFEVNLDSNISSIIQEVNSSNYHPKKPYLHLSAKSKGINRPTVIFDVKDALIYRFCIEQIEDELIKKTRQKNIRGGVKITPNTTAEGEDFYEKWFKDWMEHQNSLEESLKRKRYLVTTDIASYFENINILVLKDLIMNDVANKNGVLNLLFYFLESTRFRVNYEVNTFNGLPQESIDCSRILAYYFLSSHDKVMAEFCKKYDAEFYRYVDDMSITVNSESIGKWALKHMCESLRRLNLVSSIEKTSIIKSGEAKVELFFEENNRLSKIEQKLLGKLKADQSIVAVTRELEKNYTKLLNNKKDNYKNWHKLLKRFYTLFTYSKSSFLFKKFIEDLKKYPVLFSDNRTGKYLVQNSNQSGFNKLIIDIVNYLYSQENLYPAVESNLLEIFLLVKPACYNKHTKAKFKKLAWDLFFNKNNYKSLSAYSRALACFLIYRFDNQNVNKIATHYLKSNETDRVLRKHIIFVALTVNNNSLRENVLIKARSEQDLSINRLINFIDNIKKYKKLKIVKNYLKKDKLVIGFSKDNNFTIEQEINPIRTEVLKKLIDIYS